MTNYILIFYLDKIKKIFENIADKKEISRSRWIRWINQINSRTKKSIRRRINVIMKLQLRVDFLFRRFRIWKCNASRDNEDPSRAHEVLFNSVLAADFQKKKK